MFIHRLFCLAFSPDCYDVFFFYYNSVSHLKLQLLNILSHFDTVLIHILTVYIAFSSSSYYSNPTFLSSSLLSNPIPILSLYLYCIHHVLMPSLFYILLVKLLFQLRKVTFLFVSVVLSCLVLYLKKKLLSKICRL